MKKFLAVAALAAVSILGPAAVRAEAVPSAPPSGASLLCTLSYHEVGVSAAHISGITITGDGTCVDLGGLATYPASFPGVTLSGPACAQSPTPMAINIGTGQFGQNATWQGFGLVLPGRPLSDLSPATLPQVSQGPVYSPPGAGSLNGVAVFAGTASCLRRYLPANDMMNGERHGQIVLSVTVG